MRGTRGIQLFLEYYDNDEANAKAFEDGWFKTGDMVKMGDGRQRLLPGARQGPAEGRRRERVGQGGRGPRRRRTPRVQAVAVVGKQHEFLSEVAVAFVIPARGRPRPRRRRRRDHPRPAPTTWRRSRCPRAVYFVEEFPTGTLDKILKNKLREMADEHPAVD